MVLVNSQCGGTIEQRVTVLVDRVSDVLVSSESDVLVNSLCDVTSEQPGWRS
jgi:hypothetical protein